MPDNKDRPSGFKPIKHLNGMPWNGKFNIYYKSISDGDTENIFIGSPVSLAGGADALGHCPTIQLSGTSGIIVGVVIGFGNTRYLAADVTDLDRLYATSAQACYVAVVDDPGVIFEIQEDSDDTAMAATSPGMNCTLIAESGNTTTGRSTVEIDRSELATTITDPIKIIRLVDRVDNALGDYAKWEVMINFHAFGQGAGQTGIDS